MTRKTVTPELAGLYESQEYYREAYDIYHELHKRNAFSQAQAGMDRMKEKMQSQGFDGFESADENTGNISQLLEQWVDLIVLQHRLKKYKAIKSRFI